MEKIVISKWKHKPFEQVVYKEAIGKNKKGKTIYSSITRHELKK